MAATGMAPAYVEALVILGTAGVVVPLARRFGVSPVFGYLGAGALLGPLGLGSLVEAVPPLQWLTIRHAEDVAAIRRTRCRLPAVRHRSRALLRAAGRHAPAGARPRRTADRGDDTRHRHLPCRIRPDGRGRRRPRRLAGAVVDGDRAAGSLRPGADDIQRRPCQLFGAAGAGPVRHPAADAGFGARRQWRGVVAVRHPPDDGAGDGGGCRHRHRRPLPAAAIVSHGRRNQVDRTVHRRHPVHHHRHRRHRRSSPACRWHSVHSSPGC